VDELTIRPFEERDRPAVLGLLAESLGWVGDEHHAAFFRWKHEDNPFGRSFAWVAEDVEAGVVGFRTFLRWRFVSPAGEPVEAVRAVDTATAPSHRGAGIFSRLTKHGLAEIERAGTGVVFNTPNDQSRPGYLKLGWQEVGRLPVQLRPRSVARLPRVLRSRVPAELWSESSAAGLPAADALADTDAISALLAAQRPTPGWTTERSVAFLRWRYAGFAALGYRAVHLAGSPADGFALFRVRRRGAGRECAIVEVLAPGGRRDAGALASAALQASGADHAIGLAALGRWSGFVRSARLGPVLTVRAVCEQPPPGITSWALGLGDVELF
jgi:predicted N-acetyltransferase YhbS